MEQFDSTLSSVIDSTLGLSSVGCIRGVVSMEDVIETMNSVEIVVVEEEEELFFFIFFNPIFPMLSAKIHTFAKNNKM